MTESPNDAPPWAQGPPAGYHPPDPADLTSPEHYRTVAERGRARCLAVLAEAGITRDERGKWNVENTTTTEEKKR